MILARCIIVAGCVCLVNAVPPTVMNPWGAESREDHVKNTEGAESREDLNTAHVSFVPAVLKKQKVIIPLAGSPWGREYATSWIRLDENDDMDLFQRYWTWGPNEQIGTSTQIRFNTTEFQKKRFGPRLCPLAVETGSSSPDEPHMFDRNIKLKFEY